MIIYRILSAWIMMLLLSCERDNGDFYSGESGDLLISYPGISAERVERVEIYHFGKSRSSFNSIRELADASEEIIVLAERSEARQFVAAVQNLSIGTNEELPTSYKEIECLHVVIYLDGSSEKPVYWIMTRVSTPDGRRLTFLSYNLEVGSMRIIPDAGPPFNSLGK